jgi:transposase
MIPGEYSSGGRQRLGGLSKQGDPLLRFLCGEAGIHAVRRDPELKRFYRRKLIQKGLGKARVAVARKLGIRMWIMLRDQIEYNGKIENHILQSIPNQISVRSPRNTRSRR